MFKAIFEESDEEEEDNNEAANEMSEDESSSDESISKNPQKIETNVEDTKIDTQQMNSIPSSISKINLKNLKKYLSKSDDSKEINENDSIESEPAKIVFKKPGTNKNDVTCEKVPEALKFSSLIKNLVDQQSESSDSDESISGDSYEEVSISKSKKKKKSKKHKKKKKKMSKKVK